MDVCIGCNMEDAKEIIYKSGHAYFVFSEL